MPDLMTGTESWWALWAKTSRDPSRPAEWHPLAAHLLDTLAVARLWMERYAPSSRVRDAASALGWDERTFRTVVPSLVALHDLGKACPAFQLKWSGAVSPLVEAALVVGPVSSVPALPAHGPLGVPLITAGLTRRMGWDPAAAEAVARCLGAHHGMPVTEAREKLKEGLDWAVTPTTHLRWVEARKGVVDAIFGLGLPQGLPCPPPRVTPVGALHLLAITTVIDWVASQEDVFGCANDGPDAWHDFDAAEYLANTAARRAPAALDRAGFTARRPGAAGGPAFGDLFPGLTPRPVQRLADRLLSAANDQFLLVVEDAMGQGKTEVAFQAVATSRAHGGAGSYLALPTRAASEQAFTRYRTFLETTLHADEEQLHLLHATAWMNQDYQDLRIADLRDEVDRRSGVAAGEWFTRPKRGLLGDHAVGTVDQVMLGVAAVRHHWVRLWGLAGKAVVLDEVHAYDTFMTTIIERLLEWLGATGCSVAMLSATLPTSRRHSLVAAFARGAGWPQPEPASVGYPRVGLSTVAGTRALTPDPAATERRALRVEWCDADASAIADLVVGESAAGGCVGVVCNTVRRAAAVFHEVTRRLPGTADDGARAAHLFTSRFRLIDRARIERRVLARYGKEGPGVARPGRAILIATQVIEQSLDLDFDLLVTEFAPTDLLLQRAGRLHRHGRLRPAGLAEARLLVTRPVPDEDGSLLFEAGTARVYEPHVLVRSLAALGDLPRDLVLPRDIDALVQATYADDAHPPPEFQASWEATREGFLNGQHTEQANAGQQVISDPRRDPYSSPGVLWNPDDEAARVTTRLGVDGVQVVVLEHGERDLLDAYTSKRSTATRRELMMRSLTVPPWCRPAGATTPGRWKDDAVLRRAVLVELDQDGIHVDAEGVPWHYDGRTGWVRR